MAGTTNMVRFLQQENARLTEENKQLSEEIQSLRGYILAVDALEQAAHKLSDERNLMSALDKTLSYAIGVLGASDGSLLLVDEETNELVFALTQGRVRGELPGYRIPANEGVAGWVFQNGKPAIVNNVHSNPYFSERVDQVFQFETRSLMAAPLVAHRRILGVVEVVNKTSGAEFTDTDLNLLSILALVAATALDDIAGQAEPPPAAAD